MIRNILLLIIAGGNTQLFAQIAFVTQPANLGVITEYGNDRKWNTLGNH